MPDPSTSDLQPAPRQRALVVARRGSARSGLLRALRSAGFAVPKADDPHAGIANFVERPADVVIVSVDAWTSRDLGFLREIRRRDPSTRILLLVPEGRRRLALRALQAGADAWTPEPYYPEEVVLLASSLLRPRARRTESVETPVEQTAYWVKHHVGNIATILGLDPEGVTPETLRKQVARLEAMLGKLSNVAFPSTGPAESLDLAEIAEAALERAPRVEPGRIALRDTVHVRAPRRQLEHATDALVDCLVGLARDAALDRGEDAPEQVAIDLCVDESDAEDRGPSQGRARFRVPRLDVETKTVRQLRETPLWVGEWTREPYAGLWLLVRLTREHGGQPVFRPSTRGTQLGFSLPVT